MAQINILTACSRPENLPILEKNLLEIKNHTNHDVHWHICFDSKKTKVLDEFKSRKDWIWVYESAMYFKAPNESPPCICGLFTMQMNTMLTNFANGLFEGFLYILDDDTLLPFDFLEYDYNENESLVYLFNQSFYGSFMGHDSVYQIRDNKHPNVDKIDMGQIMWHSKINLFIEHNGRRSDGKFIEKICKMYTYKVLDEPVLYYNRLTWGS